MDILNWYLTVLRKYAVFGGRARRREFWFFNLVSFVVIIVLTVLDNALGTFDQETDLGLFESLYYLAVLIPSLAVTARRLHDTDRSGWWMLLMLPFMVATVMGAMAEGEMPENMGMIITISTIGLIALIALLVFTVLDSHPGDNRFGPNPKGEGSGSAPATASDSGMGMGAASGAGMGSGADSSMAQGSGSDSGMRSGADSGMGQGSDPASDSNPPPGSN